MLPTVPESRGDQPVVPEQGAIFGRLDGRQWRAVRVEELLLFLPGVQLGLCLFGDFENAVVLCAMDPVRPPIPLVCQDRLMLPRVSSSDWEKIRENEKEINLQIYQMSESITLGDLNPHSQHPCTSCNVFSMCVFFFSLRKVL